MQSYLERYQQGEEVAVWAELVGLGPAIRGEPLFADALAVAHEMMRRAKHNVGLLVERLKSIDYRFVDTDEAWVPPDAEQLSAIDELEGRFGPFPLSIRMWCEIVGSVDFMGAHPKLSQCHGYDWGGSDQLGCYGDPIIVWPMVRQLKVLLPYYLNRAENEEEFAEMEATSPPPYGLSIGLTGVDKAGQSGGGGVDMLVPNSGFDAPLIDTDGYWTGTMFVGYIRTCFEWGGFPGLKGGWYPGQEWDPSYSKTEKDLLTEDLLPV
jgi:hypothetical protein